VRRSTDALIRSLLLAGAALAPAGVAAQAPVIARPPSVAPDEVDFEGLTSLSLGSGARALGMGGAFLARRSPG